MGREATSAEARLRALVRTPSGTPGYRAACLEAIRLSEGLDAVGLEFENLVAEFIRSGPRGDAEAEAFLALARLYERNGFSANAVEAAQKVLVARPGDAAALALLTAAGRVPGSTLPIAPPSLPPLPEVPRHPTRRLDPSHMPGATTPAAPPPLPQVRVAGRYELLDEIGRGGTSVVFRARDSELGEDVALKFLTGGSLDAEADARFKQELKLSRQLLHPNIVRLYDIGQHEGRRFISMELLSGRDLARILRGGALPVSLALDHLVECCAGLQAAHEQGVIHRDIKPANLFVTTTGALKIMDFGIAKLQKGPSLTSTDLVAGTPAYVAPEQIRGFSEVSPAADLYSLGVVAFEMVTGTIPFKHPEAISLLMMHIQEPPPLARSRNPEVPPLLESAILRLMAKAPGERYPSCRELGRVLAEIRHTL